MPDRTQEQPVYSDYTQLFLEIEQPAIDRNIRKLETRVESFRLALDLALIRRYAKGPDLLDFPIGTGRIYPRLLREFEVFGFDICEPYVARAKALHPEIAERFSIHSFETVESERRFDSVLSFRVMTNIHDKPLAIANVFSLLKPGGRWIFTFFPGKNQVTLADVDGWLAAAGFRRVARVRYDVNAQWGSMGPLLDRFWPYWRSAVERRWVPFWLYRLADRLIPGAGTYLYVVERP